MGALLNYYVTEYFLLKMEAKYSSETPLNCTGLRGVTFYKKAWL